MSDLLVERIYDQFDMVYEALIFKGMTRDDAHDVTQETLIKAVRKRRQLRDLDKLKPWLLKIADREAKHYLKKQTKRWDREVHTVTNVETGQEIDIFETVEDKETVEKIVCEAERRQKLQELINLLNKKERIIFVRHHFHGYRLKEIAEDLGIKETTVRSIHSRTCKKLPAMAEKLFRKEDYDLNDQ